MLHIEVNNSAMCKCGEIRDKGRLFYPSEPVLHKCSEIQSSHCYMAASH